MIVCAGEGEIFDFATSMGVGLVDMTLNLTQRCSMHCPKFLLFVGSAGSYGKYKPFDIVQSMQASQIELSFLEKNSYTPIDNMIATNIKSISNETIVNSSNYITTNINLSKKFSKLGIELENMEFFAFLRVAKEFNLPAGGVFIVTNYTNKDAHEDFLKNHELAMKKVAIYVNKIINKR